jgi:hypothetical protein
MLQACSACSHPSCSGHTGMHSACASVQHARMLHGQPQLWDGLATPPPAVLPYYGCHQQLSCSVAAAGLPASQQATPVCSNADSLHRQAVIRGFWIVLAGTQTWRTPQSQCQLSCIRHQVILHQSSSPGGSLQHSDNCCSRLCVRTKPVRDRPACIWIQLAFSTQSHRWHPG